MQGLDAPLGQKAVKGRQHAARGLANQAQILSKRPVRRDGKAADGIVVPGQVLGAAVHHHIRSQADGPLEARGQKGVVHNQQGAGPVGCGPGQAKVGHVHHGVGGGFHIDGLRFRANGCPELFRIGGVHKVHQQAVLPADVVEQAGGATVEILADNDVIPRAEQLKHRRNGRHARGKGHRRFAALQGRQFLLYLQ